MNTGGGEAVGYYDVQNMISDARSEIRGEIDRAVRESRQRLWKDVKLEVRELRDEIGEASERVSALGEVTAQLRAELTELRAAVLDDMTSLQRLVNSRTEHLA
jgi:uncharacterized coiled-coil DUF342 family protein